MGNLMASLACPGCGSQVEVEQFAKSSEEFCRTCDYPLFWATPPQALTLENGDGAEPTLRRLPGAGGRQAIASAACPTCMELNALDAEVCTRCGGPMVLVEPEPEPEPEPVAEVAPEPEPEFFPEPKHDWRPWALLAILAVIAIVILVLLVG